jgi:3-phenylpropionate/trans-cinnamate dioxygenase ferredoxin reductase component
VRAGAAVVIVGAGQGGLETAAALRAAGHNGRVVLVGDEPGLPYQRPPLSKALLAGEANAGDVVLRPAAFFAEHEIELLAGRRVVSLDRSRFRARLDDGAELEYDHLVLATGARNRRLTLPGADLDGVLALRTVADAIELRERLAQTEDLTIIGAGFIGLEVASVARAAGVAVTVFEIAPRPMARMLSEPVSRFFTARHRERGVELRLADGVQRIIGERGCVTGVVDGAGRRWPAQLVLAAVGIEPNDELAAGAGLAVARGVCVDEWLVSGDQAIYALGDCARFPSRFSAAPVLLESVQNASAQARAVAARIAGGDGGYDAVPWFWSDQAGVRLQIAGLTARSDETVVIGELETARFSSLCFTDGRLRGVESVGRPGDHVAARRLLAGGSALSPAVACGEEFDLKAYARAA